MSENETNWPDFETLTLIAAGTPFSGAYIHGMMVALLCMETATTDSIWKKLLKETPSLNNPAGFNNRLFESLFRMTATHLEENKNSVFLMLPDDEYPMNERLDALANWCEGFLYGAKLASIPREVLLQMPSVLEVLEDMLKIVDISTDEQDCEDNERDYYEMVQFVSVGVLLIHEECQGEQDVIMIKKHEKITLH